MPHKSAKEPDSARKNQLMKLPTPIGLLQEKGAIGKILRCLPRAALDEAETRNDPWTWLAGWVQKHHAG
jgi:hypothetical protein